jgi:hypothetical protein
MPGTDIIDWHRRLKVLCALGTDNWRPLLAVQLLTGSLNKHYIYTFSMSIEASDYPGKDGYRKDNAVLLWGLFYNFR